MNAGAGAAPGFDEGSVFRSLFAAYPDALLLVDEHGQIVLANPAAAELLGYAAGELPGLSVDALVPDAIRPRHADYRKTYSAHPRPRPMGLQMDLVAKRRDGSEVRVEIALSPLRELGLPFVVAAIRGVGAYPRVRQALQRARYAEALAQFGRYAVDARDPQQLLQRLPVVAAEALQARTARILLLDPDGQALRLAAGSGLALHEALGAPLALEAGSPAARALDSGKPLLAGGDSPQGPCEIAVPLSDRGRAIGVVTVQGGADVRLGDDELRFVDSLSSLLATVLQRVQSEDALKHSQRLESIGQLTGGIAHDFNNLLTVISGNLQVLQDLPACAGDPVAPQLIAAAARATRRGGELTGKLLAFSRRQVLQPARIDVAALLRSLADMLRRTLDQHIAITLDLQSLSCRADPVQLESALLNIAINARDAMPDGGRLAFSCRAVETLPAHADAAPVPPRGDGFVAITVADTGSGMPESVKARAFEPFFTTKEAGRGTGLGLSTVYGFASQSQGAVQLDSTPGVGTSLTLYLPREREAAAAAPSGGNGAATGPVLRGLRVLLVEDDAEVRGVVQRFLDAMGCRVEAHSRAEEALQRLANGSNGDAPDLLLTDVALGGGLRGTELAQQAARIFPGLPVLLMSGFSSELLGDARGTELLRKPFERAELERAMARVLAAPPK